MAIESMTGFARIAGMAGSQSWAWEARSVNGRGLDVRLRVPPGLDALGEAARKRLASAFSRGTIHVGLTLSTESRNPLPRINEQALAALVAAVERLPQAPSIRLASLDGLLGIRGVVEYGEEEGAGLAAIEAPLAAAVDQLADALKQARSEEGRALESVISRQLDTIAALTVEAETHPARSREAIAERLRSQVEALLETGQGLDSQRLHQEAALLAVRADVREEIDRLHAHVAAARALLAQGGPIGRKLDFLAQEFGREASTLCAKANDPALSRIGLELRTVVDQMREQVQNVE